jgi:hypothetical protein
MKHSLLATVAFFCLFAHNAQAAQPDAKAIKVGVVGAAKETLSAQSGANAPRIMKMGDEILFEEKLTTDANGQTQLIFIDKSTLTIGPNASVTIDKFVFDPSKSSGELAVSSSKGVLRFVGGALSKKQPVSITTPSATIGIRGGIALVTIEEGGKTNATFLYGDKMTVQNAAGITETTKPGMAVNIASATTPPSLPVPVDAATLAKSTQQLQSSPPPAKPAESTTQAANKETKAEEKPVDQADAKEGKPGEKPVEGKAADGQVAGEKPAGGKDAAPANNPPPAREGMGGAIAGDKPPAPDMGKMSPAGMMGGGMGGMEGMGKMMQDATQQQNRAQQLQQPTIQNRMQPPPAGTTNVPLPPPTPMSFSTLPNMGLSWLNLATPSDTNVNLQGRALVDWERNKYIMAKVMWGEDDPLNVSGPNPRRSGVNLSIDSISRTAGDNFINDTNAFSLVRKTTDTVPNTILGSANGTVTVASDGVLGNNGNVQQIKFNLMPEAATGTVGPVPSVAVAGRSTTAATLPGADKGFMAGFLVKGTGIAATDYVQLSNTDANNVALWHDATNSQAAAKVNLQGSSGSNVSAEVGSTSVGMVTEPGGESIYINEKSYAMTGNNATYSAPLGVGLSNTSSALVTGNFARPDMQCANCEFVQWGVWAMKTDVSSPARVDNALIPYVAGKMTEDLPSFSGSLPVNVTYTGPVIGSQLNGNNLTNTSGTFSAGVNMTNREITTFTGNLGTQDFSKTAPNVAITGGTGAAVFNNMALQGSNGLTGTAQGALFGPQAQNMAGNFTYTVASGTGGGTAVFLGAR